MILKSLVYRAVAIVTVLPLALGMIATPAHAFKQADLDRLKKTKSCMKCDLSGVNLKGLNLKDLNLWGANLTNANLTNANLTNANMTGVKR